MRALLLIYCHETTTINKNQYGLYLTKLYVDIIE